MDEDEMQVKEWRNMLYYTINKVCEETSSVYGVSFTVNFIAALTELACRQIKHMAEDTEIFSRHGKRTIINSDDVKLLTRKSGALLDFIEEKISENARNKQKEKPLKFDTGRNIRNTNEEGKRYLPSAKIFATFRELLFPSSESVHTSHTSQQKSIPTTSAPKKKKKNCARDDDEDLII